jgi:hypothetical protein
MECFKNYEFETGRNKKQSRQRTEDEERMAEVGGQGIAESIFLDLPAAAGLQRYNRTYPAIQRG